VALAFWPMHVPLASRRALWTFALAAAAPAIVAPLAGGCSSSSSGEAPDAQASAVCPDTLAGTIGASCSVERLVCSPQYACGVAVATARCVCTSGAFSCTDLADAPLMAPDATPTCPPLAHQTPAKCPPTSRAADLAACTEPGLLCTYLAGCDATPAFDQCQCASGPMPGGKTGLRFDCFNACAYVAAPVELDSASGLDANVPPADHAAQDAPADAGASPPDGASDARSTEASD
jgi:hypothetical protein